LRHAHGDGDDLSRESGDKIDHDDADARVSHDVEAETPVQAAEFGGGESDVKAGQDDTGDFGAAQQGHAEDKPLAPAFSTTNNNDISDNKMALPRVT